MIVHQPAFPPSRPQEVADLRRRLARLEGLRRQQSAPADAAAVFSTGAEALDQLLPEGGLRRGSLVEWLSAGPSSGASALALVAARQACQEGRTLVIVDRGRRFYPPAAAAWSLDLARLVVIHPAHDADGLWAFDQALRCRGIGAVWGFRQTLDVRDFRRLALAAESGGTLGLLIRPASVRGDPLWADVQLLVSPRPSRGNWRLHVEVTRCRGSDPGQAVELEVEEWTGAVRVAEKLHETHSVHPAAELARAAAGRRA